MKKYIGLIFYTIICCFVLTIPVSANTDRVKEVENLLKDYKFEFKYVDMAENFNYLCKDKEEYCEHIEEFFFKELVYNDIDKLVNLKSNEAIDLFCYVEGKEYYDWTIDENKVADKDFCVMSFYTDYHDSKNFTLNGDFQIVEGDESLKKEAFSIVKEGNKDVNVADTDLINHYLNYAEDTSTFFSSKNASKEFNHFKKLISKYPKFNFNMVFEETRRGDYYSSAADGCLYIEKDGIIYGYLNNEYTVFNMFFVPSGVKQSEYKEVLKERIEKYINDKNVKIKIKDYQENSEVIDHIDIKKADVAHLLTGLFNIKVEDYYKLNNTTNKLEKEKLKGFEENYMSDESIAMFTYELWINDTKHLIGVTNMDEKYLNFGVTSSVDNKTGIMINTSSGNVPLDSELKVEDLELNEMQKELLEQHGYKDIKGYKFGLYSSLLDKIISNFNNVTEVYIPINGDVIENIKVIYINDEADNIEDYEVKIVEIEGKKYYKFDTNHFSDYVLVENIVKTDEKLPEPPEIPETSDNINLYTTMFVVSVISIILAKKSLKEN